MISRREWLELVGAAAALGALGCGDNEPGLLTDLDGGVDPLPLDASAVAAAFEVTGSGALIWAYARKPRWAAVVIEDLVDGGAAASMPFELLPEAAQTGWIELDGLEPDRDYRYHVRFDNGRSTGWQTLRTAPDPGADADVTFLFSADIDTNPEFDSPIQATMADSGAAFYLSLGDWPYADNAPGAMTLLEYHERHRIARTDDRARGLVAALPVYAIYDDHEVRNDWDAYFRAGEPERIAAGIAAWDAWFPLRREPDQPRYRRVQWGRHLDIFILDTRLYRSANRDPDGPDKTMLGAAQKQWLIDGVTRSNATFKLIGTSVPLDFGNTEDHWNVFATEREEILSALGYGAGGAPQVPGVVWLTADQHWFAAHHLDGGAIEWQVGPIARGLPDPSTLPPLVPEVVARTIAYNYGEITITGGDAPSMTFVCRDQDGGEIYRETIASPA